MGENNSKRSNRQRINLKNIQETPPAQLQKNKWSNQKMGQRTKQTLLQGRHALTLWPGLYLSLQPVVLLPTCPSFPGHGGQKATPGLSSDWKSRAGWVVRWVLYGGPPGGWIFYSWVLLSIILTLRTNRSFHWKSLPCVVRVPLPAGLLSTHPRMPSLFSCKVHSSCQVRLPGLLWSVVSSPFSEAPPMTSCQYRNHMLFWFPQAGG